MWAEADFAWEFLQITETLRKAFPVSNGGAMGKLGILKEFWDFLKVRKKWWLTPIVVVMVLLGALIVFSQGSTLSPFIYTLF